MRWIALLPFAILCGIVGCDSPRLENPADPTNPLSLLLRQGPPVTVAPLAPKRLYLAAGNASTGLSNAAPVSGTSFSGVAGADLECNNDIAKPAGSGVYKAMIVDGTNRVASLSANAGDGQIDWVFKAGVEYRRADGTLLATATSARLLPTLSAPIDTSLAAQCNTLAYGMWTGLAADWTTASHCTTWSAVGGGNLGDPGCTGATLLNNGAGLQGCGNQHRILCVEQ